MWVCFPPSRSTGWEPLQSLLTFWGAASHETLGRSLCVSNIETISTKVSKSEVKLPLFTPKTNSRGNSNAVEMRSRTFSHEVLTLVKRSPLGSVSCLSHSPSMHPVYCNGLLCLFCLLRFHNRPRKWPTWFLPHLWSFSHRIKNTYNLYIYEKP